MRENRGLIGTLESTSKSQIEIIRDSTQTKEFMSNLEQEQILSSK
jgi:hypothetical protein